MLVFGDVERRQEASILVAEVGDGLAALPGMPADLARHAELVRCYITAADLVRGLLDAEFEASGVDRPTSAGAEGMSLLAALAGVVDRSWTSGFADLGDLSSIGCGVRHLVVPATIITKPAEGYAFYALYPELYAEAARRSGLPPSTRVIGIRSIGTSLAPMVSVALGAEPAVTVRPVGHPFNRQLSLSPQLAECLLAGMPPAFAIVDEGPGQSGSSFSCVAEWLVDHGVARDCIHRFPSHLNPPGAMAGPERLAHWCASPAHHVPFEELEPRLTEWVTERIGPLTGPLLDLAGGRWRDFVGAPTARSPVAPAWERRKYVAQTSHGSVLVKFAGLGEEGRHKLAIAQHLHARGFCPEPLGLVHGFLVSRWIEAPALLDATVERDSLLGQLAAYLACRAEVPAEAGGSLVTLREMALHNTSEALGKAVARRLERRLAHAEELERLVWRVETDNRLQAWEWLVLKGGLIKTDAVDHAHSHDFVGPQDITWDVAGAIVEHELDPSEAKALTAALAQHTGRHIAPELLSFLLPCYLAFQLGSWTMTVGSEAPITRRYLDRLGAELA